MKIEFYKYHGTGNDFIIIDNRILKLKHDNITLYRNLCERKFGIGADGIILLQDHPKYDFEMVYFNADGKLGSACGNGARCVVDFARSLGLINDKTRLWLHDGLHEAKIIDNGFISIKMNDTSDISIRDDYILVNTGSPHYVKFTENLEALDVFKEGRSIRYSERFLEEGINVNFVEPQNDTLFVRTYERGVEDETLSCGTGAIATVISAAVQNLMNNISPQKVKTKGGELLVHYEKKGDNSFTNIWLEGPAKMVYKGEIEV